jgi:hypothetical protein
MFNERKKLYRRLEKLRGSKLITYVTSDRQGMEAQVAPDVLTYLSDQLDAFKSYTGKISLLLSTRGGFTLAGWGFVNLLKMYCDEFEVIIPSKAHSTGTLIAIGANSIVMTKQATLSPIDPSINGFFNPILDDNGVRKKVPVSVEDVTKYFELARKEIGEDKDLTTVLQQLSSMVHPLCLGVVHRSRTQIQMLAKKLLQNSIEEENKIDAIIAFLCSDSGSHDYTINRREAKDSLHLPIIKPSEEEYLILKKIYQDLQDELEVHTPFEPNIILAGNQQMSYSSKRVILESLYGGSHKWVSEGTLSKLSLPPPQAQGMPFAIPVTGVNDQRNFEGWKHEK